MKKLLRLRAVVAQAADMLRTNANLFGPHSSVKVVTPVREALERAWKDSDPSTP